MHSFRLFTGVAAFLAAASICAQSGGPQTLDDLLTRAIQNNRELQAIHQRIDEARGLLRQAGVRPATTLNVSGYAGRPLATLGEEQLSAGVSHEFETAGKRGKRIDVAEKRLAFAQAEYQERVRQLRFDISARYADYAADTARLDIIGRSMQSTRASIDLTRARVENGDAAALELQLQEVELTRIEAQRTAIAGRVESARLEIARLAGLASGESWSVTPQPEQQPLNRTDLTRQALERRPDLLLMRLAEQEGTAETALAEADARPNVTVSAGYARVSSRFDDQFGFRPSGQLTQLQDRDNVLTAGVSVPLFSRRRNLGNIEAAVARSRAARLRKEFLERSIPLEIEAAWQRLESARRTNAALTQQAIPLAEKNLDVIRQAYQLGQLRMLDVLNEQRRVLDIQLGAIDSQAELFRSLADLEKAAGGSLQ